jgi:hypothetical protein
MDATTSVATVAKGIDVAEDDIDVSDEDATTSVATVASVAKGMGVAKDIDGSDEDTASADDVDDTDAVATGQLVLSCSGVIFGNPDLE